MSRRNGFGWTVAAFATIVVLSVACAPVDDESRSASTDGPDGATAELPAAALMIVHRVEDYDAWKTVFDAHRQAREAAGCLGHELKRGLDDPARVYVYCLSGDPDAVQEFLDSEDLAEAMQSAGVVGEPELMALEPMTRNLAGRPGLAGIVVMHEVEDYDTWREEYDAFDAYREEHGIVGDAVSRHLDDSNRVVVYHQAEKESALRELVESDQLRDVMQRAGVVGEPDIRFVRSVETVEY